MAGRNVVGKKKKKTSGILHISIRTSIGSTIQLRLHLLLTLRLQYPPHEHGHHEKLKKSACSVIIVKGPRSSLG